MIKESIHPEDKTILIVYALKNRFENILSKIWHNERENRQIKKLKRI